MQRVCMPLGAFSRTPFAGGGLEFSKLRGGEKWCCRERRRGLSPQLGLGEAAPGSPSRSPGEASEEESSPGRGGRCRKAKPGSKQTVETPISTVALGTGSGSLFPWAGGVKPGAGQGAGVRSACGDAGCDRGRVGIHPESGIALENVGLTPPYCGDR